MGHAMVTQIIIINTVSLSIKVPIITITYNVQWYNNLYQSIWIITNGDLPLYGDLKLFGFMVI